MQCWQSLEAEVPKVNMAERRRDFAGNHEDDLENEWPSPLTTSFLEDYRRSNLSTAQRRPTHLSHSLTSSHINTPNSLQPSRCQTSTGGNLTPNPSNFEDALSETHFRLDSPYRPLELPSHFGFAEEETRRSYTPFPRLDTPPHSHSRSESRTSSNERAIGSSSHSPESDSFNAFVDLTQDSPKMPPPRRQAKSNKTISRSSSEELLKSVKRRKAGTTATSIEEVDLRDVDSDTDLARVLERQRVATVKAQQEEADKPTKLANVTCVVCMEEMTNMTATHCGHLFCHTCLMEALIAGENQATEPGKGASKCPICRKKIKRPKDNREAGQVVPLEIRVKKRASMVREKGKGKGKGNA